MNIEDLKKSTNVTLKVKPDKFIDSKEITNKEGEKIKLEKWEVVDEEENRIECTFFGEQNIERVNDNIGKWITLFKFWCSEYEEKLSLSSAKFGYVRPFVKNVD